jgi:hypothetical protein
MVEGLGSKMSQTDVPGKHDELVAGASGWEGLSLPPT